MIGKRDGLRLLALTVTSAVGLAFPATPFAGTWALQNSGGGGAAAAVAIVDDTTAVGFGMAQQPGSDDAVPVWLRTTNGSSWNLSQAQGKKAGDLLMVSSIVCPQPTKCLAAVTNVDMGSGGFPIITNAILTSTDGGQSFKWPPTKQWSNDQWAFTNIDYVSDSVIWLSNGPNVAAVKSAGGMFEYQWKVPQVGETKYLSIVDIDFVDENVGFAVNAKASGGDGAPVVIEPEGTLLKTTDGGASWSILYDGRAELAVDLQALSPTLLYLSGRTADGPFLRRSEDGGQNWTEIAIPAGSVEQAWTSVDAYRAFDRDTAYVIMGAPVGQESYVHSIFEMRDGTTPVEVLPNPTGHSGGLFAMDCAGPNLCWAVGADMAVVKYEGDGGPGEDPGSVIPDVAAPDAVEPDASVDDDRGTQVDPGPFPFDDGYVPRDLAGAGGSGGSGGCVAGGPALPGAFAFGASLLALAGLRIRGRRRC